MSASEQSPGGAIRRATLGAKGKAGLANCLACFSLHWASVWYLMMLICSLSVVTFMVTMNTVYKALLILGFAVALWWRRLTALLSQCVSFSLIDIGRNKYPPKFCSINCVAGMYACQVWGTHYLREG
eukprot:860465-Pelagomonas_calceolata.AAC.3